jgi:hypothetical protein
MSPSYRQVHYGTRAAKSIERKMIASALLRLDRFHRLEQYRYVGFGSIFFTDFLLFHRVLGLESMISIEEQVQDEDRFRFNLPLKCLDLVFGHSSQILPTLDFGLPSIIWLDYDTELDGQVLSDVETVVAQIASGSVFIVTVNAQPSAPQEPGQRLARLRNNVGGERVPLEVTADAHLAGWKLAQVSRRIIAATMERVLADRNAPLHENRIRYQQLFNFHYADGPKMLTVGGIFYAEEDLGRVEACAFEGLEQVALAEEPFELRVPALTTREVLHLDSQLPDEATPQSPGVPPSDVASYARVHRHYPLYVDVDL